MDILSRILKDLANNLTDYIKPDILFNVLLHINNKYRSKFNDCSNVELIRDIKTIFDYKNIKYDFISENKTMTKSISKNTITIQGDIDTDIKNCIAKMIQEYYGVPDEIVISNNDNITYFNF